MRGQIELPAVGISLLLVTLSLVLSVGIAHSTLAATDRSPVERQTAVGLSDRLVDSERLTVRPNVLSSSKIPALTGNRLYSQFGLPTDADARVTIDGTVVASTGTVGDGRSIERIVLIERSRTRTIRPEFKNTNSVVLPRRAERVTLELSPPKATNVTRVWANGRVLLANEQGLSGTYDLSLSPFETTTLRFETVGRLTSDHVRLSLTTGETRKAIMEVTVDG